MVEITENTINDLVADFLRTQQIQITREQSGRTQYGRNQPDFIVRNSGLVFGEGEWQSSYMKGLKQAYDFGNLPGATGSFILAYPEKMKAVLSRRLKDISKPEIVLRDFKFRGLLLMKGARAELFDGQIEEVVEWLRDGIQHKRRKENAGEFVTLMRDIVEELSDYLPSADKYPTFFEHIIASMPKHAEEQETAKRAAAYLLLNQVVFYRILSPGRYPPLDSTSLDEPAALHSNYFERVLKDDYAAIFSSNIAELFPNKSLQFIKDMINIVNVVQPESFTRDLLGSIFHELIPKEVRKSVAAFYTNPEAARLLAKLTIDDPNATVADFACGSGTLLMAAYDRKAELLSDSITEKDHRRFLEKELTGCDIMAFAAHLAAVQLALRQPGFLTDKVRIAIHDSTSFKPGIPIAPLQSSMPQGQMELQSYVDEANLEMRKIKSGAISNQGRGHSFMLEKVDITLMNPPFTRKQLVGKEYRKILSRRFQDYSDYESKEQSFFGYFVFLADRFLKPNGRMGFVLPATSIRQMSSEGMRQLIRDRYDLEYLILSGHRMAFSEDAAFSEILLIAKKRNQNIKQRRHFVLATIKNKPTLNNMATFISQLKEASAIAESNNPKMMSKYSEDIEYRIGNIDELNCSDWLALLPGEENIAIDLSNNRSFELLTTIIGKDGIIQGIRFEGSSNTVNVKNTILSRKREIGTRSNWTIIDENHQSIRAKNMINGIELDFPKIVLQPAARTPAGLQTMSIDNPLDFAVKERFPGDNQFWDDYKPEEIINRRKPHLISREGRLLIAGRNHIDVVSDNTHFLAFCSTIPVIPTWSFWSIKISNSDDARLLCLWFNSVFAMTHLYDKRIVGTGVYIGWLKADLLKIPVPNPSKLSQAARNELLSLYQRIGTKPFPSLLTQLRDRTPERVELDLTIAKNLDIIKFQSREKLYDLYDIIIKKFVTLDYVHSNE